MYVLIFLSIFLQNLLQTNVVTPTQILLTESSHRILHSDSSEVNAAIVVDTQEFRYLGQINCVSAPSPRFRFIFADSDKTLYDLYKPSIQDLAIDLDASLNFSARINGNGVRHFQFDCDETFRPTVIWESEITDISELSAKYIDENIKNVFFAKDFGVCGRSWLVPDSVKINNPNDTGGGGAFISLYCYGLRVTFHEIGHSLGAVFINAPHSDKDFHCYDAYDVLCYLGAKVYCPDYRFDSVMYDCNGDDYFRVNQIPADSYLAKNWNIADSRYLTDIDKMYFPFIVNAPNASCGTYCAVTR